MGLSLALLGANGGGCGFAANDSLGPSAGGVGGTNKEVDSTLDPTDPGASRSGGESMGVGAAGPLAQAPDGGSSDAGVDLCASLPPQIGPHEVYFADPKVRAMGSPAQARGLMLNQHVSPAPATVRVGEFLNYYRIAFDKPDPGKLSLTAALVKSATDPNAIGDLTLVIGVQAPDADPHRPTALTVVVDTSNSMWGDSMDRARAAVTSLAKRLGNGDALNIVTSNPDHQPLQVDLDGPAGMNAAVVGAIGALDADGGEDLAGAVDTAYQLAEASLRPSGLNRVVLITDGGASPTSINLQGLADSLAKSDIALVGVGVGAEKVYADTFLSVATTAGRGSDVYLDSPGEADRILFDRFDEVLDVAARDVQLKVTLPAYLRMVSVRGDDSQSPLSELAGPDFGPGRSMIFRQVLAVCGQPSTTDTIAFDLTWTPRDAPTDGTGVVSASINPTLDELFTAAKSAPVAKEEAIAAYAFALQALDPSQLKAAYALVIGAIALPELASDADLAEIRDVIEKNPVFKLP
jgi:Ca-activated chloride channel family protein